MNYSSPKYVTVAASQTAAAVGKQSTTIVLERVIIVPATVSAGAVTIIDGDTSIIVFPGGTNSLTELKPIVVELNAIARNATTPGWKITTGADVSVVAIVQG